MRRVALLFLVLAGVFVFAGCGGGDDDGGGGDDSVDLTQSQDVTIAMVTHGDGGSFWSVAKKGAEKAAEDLGVTLKYSESNNDPEEQAQLIEAAVTEGVDGLAVSAPNPDAIRDALATAKDAGIPIITLNSGAEESASLGAITHVGQTETIAGEGAGRPTASSILEGSSTVRGSVSEPSHSRRAPSSPVALSLRGPAGPAAISGGGDCFVAPLLAMTAGCAGPSLAPSLPSPSGPEVDSR
jgi:ABC-type sugar transport system substrate-binding protein